MKEPARSAKAVLLPIVMAPRAVQRTAARSMAGTGQLSLRFTLENIWENGMALSRASDHHIRLSVRNVPTRQMRMEKKMISKRPKVAPLFPVA